MLTEQTEPKIFNAHPVQKNYRENQILQVGMAVCLVVLTVYGDPPLPILALLVFGTGSLLYGAFVKPRRQMMQYEFERHELCIRSDKRTVRIPYDAIKGLSAQQVQNRPYPLRGESYRGHTCGLFRLHGYEIHLYTTRSDRIVFLDTTEGLYGLTPAAGDEDAFVKEIEKRSHITRSLETLAHAHKKSEPGFVPQHAEKAGAVWPLITFALVANHVAMVLGDQMVVRGVKYYELFSGVTVLAVIFLYGPLLRLQKLQPWLFPALSVLGLLFAFGRYFL